MKSINVFYSSIRHFLLHFLTAMVISCALGYQCCNAADLSGKTVEVYDTGGIGLRAWTSTCSGTYVNKADGTRGLVVSSSSQSCDGYNRWQVRWSGDSTDRWSAEDWLRVVPCDLGIAGSVNVTPTPVVQGGRITVSCIITNVGQGYAPPSGTTITVFRAASFDWVTSVDSIETLGVAPGSSITFSYELTLPNDIPAGNYVVHVEVDSRRHVGEVVVRRLSRGSQSWRALAPTYDDWCRCCFVITPHIGP